MSATSAMWPLSRGCPAVGAVVDGAAAWCRGGRRFRGNWSRRDWFPLSAETAEQASEAVRRAKRMFESSLRALRLGGLCVEQATLPRHRPRKGRAGRTGDRLTATSDERCFLLRAEAGCGWRTCRWANGRSATIGRPPHPAAGDVRLREIVALEQQPGPVGLRTGVGKAIAHVEGGRVPSLAELGIGLGCKLELALADADEPEIVRLDEALHHGSGRRNRKRVGPTQAGDRLPHRDCRAQAQPFRPESIGQAIRVALARHHRNHRRRVDKDHQGSSDRSSKNALSAACPVGGGIGCSFRHAAMRSRSGIASRIRSNSACTARRTASCLDTPRFLASCATNSAVASSLM